MPVACPKAARAPAPAWHAEGGVLQSLSYRHLQGEASVAYSRCLWCRSCSFSPVCMRDMEEPFEAQGMTGCFFLWINITLAPTF
jgi:hypothetical protein